MADFRVPGFCVVCPSCRASRLLGCVLLMLSVGLIAGCGKKSTPSTGVQGNVIKIALGPEAQKQAQTALIEAQSGDVIEFAAGTFDFDSTLSCDASNVTIRGQGHDKTILSFAKQGQGTGGEGLSISSKEKCTIENLAVVDAKGDAIKINRCDGVTLRGVRTSWTGGPKTENGAYGLYPVLSNNVLIEDCIATDASDAGIYVGQSTNIIVRRCRAENNVAGIEIENSVHADVYENVATGNTGGILVFSLPDLELKVGRVCRVFNNKIIENNHENFAPQGNAVANVPQGTGVMILASRQVEVFDNEIRGNQSVGLSICSYLVTQKPFDKDPGYDPFCDSIYIHHNKFENNGAQPSDTLGKMVAMAIGAATLPDIIYDGVVDPSKAVEGRLPAELAILVRDNGDAEIVNFDLAGIDLSNPLQPKFGNVDRDLTKFVGEGDLPRLDAVSIPGVE